MEKPQGAAISASLRTLTRVPHASGDTAAPLLFLVQSEKCTTDSDWFYNELSGDFRVNHGRKAMKNRAGGARPLKRGGKEAAVISLIFPDHSSKREKKHLAPLLLNSRISHNERSVLKISFISREPLLSAKRIHICQEAS
jgi:hypothetical protein